MATARRARARQERVRAKAAAKAEAAAKLEEEARQMRLLEREKLRKWRREGYAQAPEILTPDILDDLAVLHFRRRELRRKGRILGEPEIKPPEPPPHRTFLARFVRRRPPPPPPPKPYETPLLDRLMSRTLQPLPLIFNRLADTTCGGYVMMYNPGTHAYERMYAAVDAHVPCLLEYSAENVTQLRNVHVLDDCEVQSAGVQKLEYAIDENEYRQLDGATWAVTEGSKHSELFCVIITPPMDDPRKRERIILGMPTLAACSKWMKILRTASNCVPNAKLPRVRKSRTLK